MSADYGKAKVECSFTHRVLSQGLASTRLECKPREKICVRLRPANNRDAFLPYNSIVGTFLHELTHMQIAPHNAAFYALLDELWTECEAIMDNNMFQNKFKNNMFNARGGDGSSVNGNSNTTRFAGKGHRLSQNVGNKMTMKNKRQALATAALKRAKYNNAYLARMHLEKN